MRNLSLQSIDIYVSHITFNAHHRTASLAPTGMEGLFFAVGSSRALLAPVGDVLMGTLNSIYNPNCPGK